MRFDSIGTRHCLPHNSKSFIKFVDVLIKVSLATMQFPTAALLLLASSAEAASKLTKLASSSSAVKDGRKLEDYYNDITWMADYSIKFESCHFIVQYDQEGGEEVASKTKVQHLAKFKICDSSKCNSKCGGEYLVDLATFVDSYTEFQMEEQEYFCELTRENCNCQYANDDEVCENQCYADAGQDYCIELQDEYEEEFEVQRYLECEKLELQNQEYDQYGQEIEYFVGPTCSKDGTKVNLAVFSDEFCSVRADNGIYSQNNYYKKSLPYSSESLVQANCISCEERDRDAQAEQYGNNNAYGNNNNAYGNNNNAYGNNYGNNNNAYNNQNNKEVTEICETNYELAAKCEKGLDVLYPKNDDCEYVTKTIYQQEEGGGSSGVAVGFAWFFAITTAILAGFSYQLYQQKNGSKVDLSAQGATGALA